MHHLYLPSSWRAKMNKNWKTQNNTTPKITEKSIVENTCHDVSNNIVDVDIFFLKTWLKLIPLNFWRKKNYTLFYGTEVVCHASTSQVKLPALIFMFVSIWTSVKWKQNRVAGTWMPWQSIQHNTKKEHNPHWYHHANYGAATSSQNPKKNGEQHVQQDNRLN
jgi:hypothetical protein